jgi:hypothetical protein
MKAPALIACAIAAGLMLGAAVAWGHGDAEWVMNGGYRDNTGMICCNDRDCARAGKGEIKRIQGGWLHVPTNSVLMDGDAGIHVSIDADTWRCVPNGRMNCLFVAAGI